MKEGREELPTPFPYRFLMRFVLEIQKDVAMQEGEQELPTSFPYWILIRLLLKSEGGEGGAPHTISLFISY